MHIPIPFMVNRTFNATPTERLQQGYRFRFNVCIWRL